MKKIIVVTGAAGGIGKAICEFLKHDYRVVGIDIEPMSKDYTDLSLQLDSANPDHVHDAVKYIEDNMGDISGLIINAAIQLNKSIIDTSYAEWKEVQRVNVDSLFMWIREAHGSLTRTSGSVVAMSSVHALATTPTIAAYAASKGAMMALVRAAAVELGPIGIRVNAILPGATDTPMLRDGFSRGQHLGENVDDQMDQLKAKHPLRRIAMPIEIAQACDFLINNQKSGFITGQGLVIDGGATIKLSTE